MKVWLRLAVVCALVALAPHGFADDEVGPDGLAPTTVDSADEPIVRLPRVDITAPRVAPRSPAPAAPAAVSPAIQAPVTQTATRVPTPTSQVPASASVLGSNALQLDRAVRSVSGALEGLPGVLVQKTAPLQHSPFIRGFTGYRNLLLIDGIRLNNSTFRSGPNQYWATVDAYSVDRLELVRGARSVLYGSDAVGGVVNVIPWQRQSFRRGIHWNGAVSTRYATAEAALFTRAQVEGNYNGVGWAGGIGYKSYGDITSGAGEQPGTGGADEFDGDLRIDWKIDRTWSLAVGFQYVRQQDAPRTGQTVDAVPFAGTVAGSELQRDFDQLRMLGYAKIAFDDVCRPFSRGHLAVSWHRHEEDRDRLRTNERRDRSGFDLDQFGIQLQLESPTALGRFTYGIDYYRDQVDSFRRNFQSGLLTSTEIQGAIGDDASYDLLGVYVQDQIRSGRWEWLLGARFTYAAASADRVDNPAVAGSDPLAPGNVIAVDNDWTNLVGSLHAIYHINREWNVYGGVAQAFRAPSLSDLTALDATSIVESPAPNLDSEQFVTFEAGVKTQQSRLRGSLAVWYTLLRDTIIASPTGNRINGTQEVRKDNIGDGYAWGIELEAAWQAHRDWLIFGNISWMNGEVEQFNGNGALVREPLDRTKPLTWMLGTRFSPCWCKRLWVQPEWFHSATADELSFRDRGDRRRIPPGGTPGWDIVNVRLGYELNRRTNLTLAFENVLNENYRIHGSGVNEPGFNVVFAARLDF